MLLEEFSPQCRVLLSLLFQNGQAVDRQGAVAVVSEMVAQMQEQLLPYMFLIVVPTMKLMSDQIASVRASATESFAVMVGMLPLAQVSALSQRSLPQPETCNGLIPYLYRDEDPSV